MTKSAQLRTGSFTTQDLLDEFAASRPRSEAAFRAARAVMPGGQTRSVTHYEPFPAILDRGEGYFLRDIDDFEYIDVLNNYTSLVHGNSFGPVVEAVTAVLGQGSAFASVHPAQIELAGRISSRVDSIESLRFTNSGSEAASLAARIARRFTGRSQIIMAEGGYHGAVPPFSDSDTEVVQVPYNDVDALCDVLSERTAAVFLEPFQGAGGVIPGDHDYLRAAQKHVHSAGALFVLDEVQSFRAAAGGAQQILGLSPDLTLLGKVIGGGFPIGAVGGRQAVLEVTSPYIVNPLSHAGTFNGHNASVTAGSVTLERLGAEAIGTLNRRSERLAELIERAGDRVGLRVSVTRFASVMNVYRGDPPQTAAAAASDRDFHSALHLALLLEGVYSATRGMLNLSTVMTDDLIEELGVRYRRAFERLCAANTDAVGGME